MEITDNRTVVKRAEFRNLDSGDVFEYGGHLFMKITCDGTMVNSVMISNGNAKCFHGDELVVPLNCHLVIEQ